MKNAVILHGAGASPFKFWFPFVKKELEKKGYAVWAPQLPDANDPDLKKYLPFVLKNFKFNKNTVMIAHSSGCPLAIGVLEKIKVPVAKVILVSGYLRSTNKDNRPKKILQKDYDWQKIKSHAKEIVFINSDNDPWGCDDQQGKYMFEKLGGTQIIRHGEGHMGSDSFHQPYKEFPLLIKLVENELWGEK